MSAQVTSTDPTTSETRRVVERFLSKVGEIVADPTSEAAAAVIAENFAERPDVFVPGDAQTVPWVGTHDNRDAIAAFYGKLVSALESRDLTVGALLVDGDRAVVLGTLSSYVRSTGKMFDSEFAFDFTVTDGRISRYHVFEDTYAISAAMKPAAT